SARLWSRACSAQTRRPVPV
ncbi:hypothetical protein AZ048_004933, partial [Escherichia coli]